MNFANVKAITIPEGNVKQITDGQGNVLWKKKELNLKITSITDPSPGSSSITGDRSATLSRSANSSQGTFTVYFKDYDVGKGAGIRVFGTIQFAGVYNGGSAAYVNIAGKSTYYQSGTGAQTISFDNTITPSSTNGAFNIVVRNGYDPYNYQLIRVYLTIAAR